MASSSEEDQGTRDSSATAGSKLDPSVLGKLPPGLEWECGPQLAFFCVWDAGYDYGSDSGSGVSMWPCARKASSVHCHMKVCLLRQTRPGRLKTRGPGFL